MTTIARMVEPAYMAGPNSRPEGDDAFELEERQKSETPKRYRVLFHNDDYTTREFVVEMLMTYFQKNEAEATHLMLNVHVKGHAVVGAYSREIAETKVEQVMDRAKERGYPLMVTAEPE